MSEAGAAGHDASSARAVMRGQRIRFYPTAGQRALLRRCFAVEKMVYNQALHQMESAYRSDQNLGINEISKRWTEFKKAGHETDVPRTVVTMTLRHLDAAFKSFFRSVKQGDKPAYPRPKGKFSPDQCTFQISPGDHSDSIRIPGVGPCRVRGRRPGNPKMVSVCRDAVGRYWLSFASEFEPELLAPNEDAIGIDLGITNFATLSDGTKIDNPRHLQRRLKALKRSQLALSRCMAKSNRRAKRKIKVARLHAKVAQAREDFLHKTSTNIVKRFGVIASEDLNVRGMVKNKRLARHISDLGMSRFVEMLKYKSTWYGRIFVQCGRWDPTSQVCSECGCRGGKLPLSVREWTCAECGSTHDRDTNAAVNVLAFAVGKTVGRGGLEPPGSFRELCEASTAFDHAEAHTTCDAA